MALFWSIKLAMHHVCLNIGNDLLAFHHPSSSLLLSYIHCFLFWLTHFFIRYVLLFTIIIFWNSIGWARSCVSIIYVCCSHLFLALLPILFWHCKPPPVASLDIFLLVSDGVERSSEVYPVFNTSVNISAIQEMFGLWLLFWHLQWGWAWGWHQGIWRRMWNGCYSCFCSGWCQVFLI